MGKREGISAWNFGAKRGEQNGTVSRPTSSLNPLANDEDICTCLAYDEDICTCLACLLRGALLHLRGGAWK